MLQRAPKTRLSRTAVTIIVAACGSSLTAACAILSHDNPAYIISFILLAGVTTASTGLASHVAKKRDESDE